MFGNGLVCECSDKQLMAIIVFMRKERERSSDCMETDSGNPWVAKVRTAFCFVLWIVCFGKLTPHSFAQESRKADLVIVHGRLFGGADPDVDSIAISGHRIWRLGSAAEIAQWIGPKTLRLDARGAAVSPGFNDAHVHFLSGVLAKQQIDLSGCDSFDRMKQEVTLFRQEHPNDSLILGRGWVYGAFDGGLPSREQLDTLVPDIPAIFKCYDGHTTWVNTKALELANITRDTADPIGGVIVKHPVTGEPSGILKESAMDLVSQLVPKPSKEEKLAALRQGIREAHQLGVTSIQEAGANEELVELYEQLRIAGELRLRVYIAMDGKADMQSADLDRLDAIRKRYRQLRIGAVKLYVDGVIESHTAALLSPYSNRATVGQRECTSEALNSIVQQLDRRDWQVMTHAIGDGGIRMTLDAYEHAQKNSGSRLTRHRIEHLETVDPSDVSRFGMLGVVASMQPYHANPNGNVLNVWAVNLGPERTRNAWPWKSILDQGGPLAFGTDWPVVALDPRLGLHVALTRQTLAGTPGEGFLARQRLNITQAIRAYTFGSAFAEFQEKEKGALEIGMLADIVIWDRDWNQVPIDEVSNARIRYTIFDGEIVHSHP